MRTKEEWDLIAQQAIQTALAAESAADKNSNIELLSAAHISVAATTACALVEIIEELRQIKTELKFGNCRQG